MTQKHNAQSKAAMDKKEKENNAVKEAASEAAMRAFLKQGLDATRGISEGLMPYIKYSANEDGSVSEKVGWVEPKKEEEQ